MDCISMGSQSDPKVLSDFHFTSLLFENLPNMGKETITQVKKAQSPIQDKPKEEHTKIYIN